MNYEENTMNGSKNILSVCLKKPFSISASTLGAAKEAVYDFFDMGCIPFEILYDAIRYKEFSDFKYLIPSSDTDFEDDVPFQMGVMAVWLLAGANVAARAVPHIPVASEYVDISVAAATIVVSITPLMTLGAVEGFQLGVHRARTELENEELEDEYPLGLS